MSDRGKLDREKVLGGQTPQAPDVSGEDPATQHVFDGIRELDNRPPLWWSVIACIIACWMVVWWILFPSWPLLETYSRGLFGNQDTLNIREQWNEYQDNPMRRKLLVTDIELAYEQPELRKWSLTVGRSVFVNNCAGCHGQNGQGSKNYPNLFDDSWIWGEQLKDIYQTIRYGIRNEEIESRQGVMSAQLAENGGTMNMEQISLLARYVMSFGQAKKDADNSKNIEDAYQKSGTRNGKKSVVAVLYEKNCASCHGVNGEGDASLGAPNLVDNIWLYGGHLDDIVKTLTHGRAGVMPAWQKRLPSLEMSKAVAIYVYHMSNRNVSNGNVSNGNSNIKTQSTKAGG